MSGKTLLGDERGIILSADVLSLEELGFLVKICNDFPEVVSVKVGFTLGLRYGLQVVVDTIKKNSDLTVIYDHQKAGTDIPQMGKPFATVCRDAGVDGVIFFPQAGPKTLEGFVSASFAVGLTPIVGTVMTHEAYLCSEGGFIIDSAPETIIQLAVQLGVKYFVLPGTKPEFVARYSQGVLLSVKDASIMMPGIGSQGGSLTQAFKAAAPHRRYAIIGSAIYAAKQPKMALENFVKELAA